MYCVSPILQEDLAIVYDYVLEEIGEYRNDGILYDIDNMNWEYSVKVEVGGRIVAFASIDGDYIGLFFVAKEYRGKLSTPLLMLYRFLKTYGKVYKFDTLTPLSYVPNTCVDKQITIR